MHPCVAAPFQTIAAAVPAGVFAADVPGPLTLTQISTALAFPHSNSELQQLLFRKPLFPIWRCKLSRD